MSEADKIIKNLKNSGKKVEEFYMSNKTSDKNVANDSVIAHKFAVMQQQINEKDKRIKELEEENVILKKASNIAKDVNIEDVTEIMNKSYKKFMSNYIPKQTVIEAISVHQDYIINQTNRNNKEKEIYVLEVLQKLLEGGLHENRI